MPISRTENAFQLAERYLDFRSLVELSVGLQPAGSRARIQYYIGKFKEEFAYVLFEWYIEKGEFWVCNVQGEAVDIFEWLTVKCNMFIAECYVTSNFARSRHVALTARPG